MLLLLVISLIYNANCVQLNIADNEIGSGYWVTKHNISIPFKIGGDSYFYGSSGDMWFIQKLKADGTISYETDHGIHRHNSANYIKGFAFNIHGRQFVFCINSDYHYFIQEILPEEKMGQETDYAVWDYMPTSIFPMNIEGTWYVFILKDGSNWQVNILDSTGRIGSKLHDGKWKYSYSVGFPYYIGGKQYIYFVSEYYWFIQQVNYDGSLGSETHNGQWKTKHIFYTPFKLNGIQYFFGISDSKTYWFIQELLPLGKMGEEVANGYWYNYYNILFPYKIHEIQYLYGVSEYRWFTQKIEQHPGTSVSISQPREFCPDIRLRRQTDDDSDTCNVNPGCSSSFNIVEQRATEIEQESGYTTTYFDRNCSHPILSVTTFTVDTNNPNRNQITLTAAMRAEIHSHHLRRRLPSDIPSAARRHLQNMDREPDDDAGHILAATLGGPPQLYNFIPQSPNVNRRVRVTGSIFEQESWYNVENMMRTFLREIGGQGYIGWTIYILYEALVEGIRRPTSYGLSIRLYDNNGQLTNWRNYSSVQVYNFLNVPTAACRDRSHPFWNLY